MNFNLIQLYKYINMISEIKISVIKRFLKFSIAAFFTEVDPHRNLSKIKWKYDLIEYEEIA